MTYWSIYKVWCHSKFVIVSSSLGCIYFSLRARPFSETKQDYISKYRAQY